MHVLVLFFIFFCWVPAVESCGCFACDEEALGPGDFIKYANVNCRAGCLIDITAESLPGENEELRIMTRPAGSTSQYYPELSDPSVSTCVEVDTNGYTTVSDPIDIYIECRNSFFTCNFYLDATIRYRFCATGCDPHWLGDGTCNSACNVFDCDYDEGDCASPPAPNPPSECAPGCDPSWPGDGICDSACNVFGCDYDEGDCASPPAPNPPSECPFVGEYKADGDCSTSDCCCVDTVSVQQVDGLLDINFTFEGLCSVYSISETLDDCSAGNAFLDELGVVWDGFQICGGFEPCSGCVAPSQGQLSSPSYSAATDSTAPIIGAAAGGVAVVVVGGAAFYYRRNRSRDGKDTLPSRRELVGARASTGSEVSDSSITPTSA